MGVGSAQWVATIHREWHVCHVILALVHLIPIKVYKERVRLPDIFVAKQRLVWQNDFIRIIMDSQLPVRYERISETTLAFELDAVEELIRGTNIRAHNQSTALPDLSK